MSYLIHFNPNHDKLGRFTFTTTAQKRATAAAKTKSDVDDIVSTFNKHDRELLGLKSENEQYLTLEEGEHVIKRILKKYGDTPVAFFDMLDDGSTVNVALGTRSGEEYRGKGYASKAVKDGLRWYEQHADELGRMPVVWGVRTDNDASIKIAKKNGFVEDPDSISKDGKWINYVRKF